jgi:hypothetical protein
MTMPEYMVSHLMLEELQHRAQRLSPNPDWPEPIPARPAPSLAGVRQRVSVVLRSIADRLEPTEVNMSAPQHAASAE